MQNQAKSFKNSIDLIYIDPPFATNNTFRLGSMSEKGSLYLHIDDKVGV